MVLLCVTQLKNKGSHHLCQHVRAATHTHPFNRPLSSTTSIGKMLNCGMWNAEGKMRNDKCGTTVIGPQVRPRDHSYYAVYHTPRVAGAVVNCVIQSNPMRINARRYSSLPVFFTSHIQIEAHPVPVNSE